MSLIYGPAQGASVAGGPWQHRHAATASLTTTMLPFTSLPASPATAATATTAASPSSSSESSRDSDHRHASYSPPPLVPSPTAAAAVTTRVGLKPGRTPSRYDWSKHMPTIKRLYIDEEKTLSQVLDIMKEKHDFVAT